MELTKHETWREGTARVHKLVFSSITSEPEVRKYLAAHDWLGYRPGTVGDWRIQTAPGRDRHNSVKWLAYHAGD